MIIFNVESVLSDDIANHPLTLTPLNALDPQRELYQTMLMQPSGDLEGNANRIGHANQATGARMCSRFLEKACEVGADLVVAPEYCVPWTVVDNIIAGQIRPGVGALWALGCESIKPQQLRELRQQIEQLNGAVRLIHEPLDSRQEAQKSYIDPLLYVFWCEDATESAVLCLLVQFKTAPCRDEGHIELTSLYLGQRVYKFYEGAYKISLLGIICSDAFEFTNQLVDQHHRNSLILHIQLNHKPGHPDYSSYRTRLFSVGSNSDSEVLCVNWARGIKWVENMVEVDTWDDIGGSAWYVPFPKFKAKDVEIDTLHRQGLYHCLVGKHWHAFFLNYSPHSLLIRKQKVFNSGQQLLVAPISPQVLLRLCWDQGGDAWIPEVPNDGFVSLVGHYANLQEHLPLLCQVSPLAVERALELLEGPDGNVKTWFNVSELEVLKVDVEESIRRITVSQETDLRRSGVKYRCRRVRRAQTAVTLSGQPVPWPPAVKDLAQGFRFRWQANDPHRNVEPLDGAGEASTLIYLDDDPEIARVEALYRKLSHALVSDKLQRVFAIEQDTRKAAEVADRSRDRLCLVFRRNHQLEVYRPSTFASITHPGGTSPVNIAGGFE